MVNRVAKGIKDFFMDEVETPDNKTVSKVKDVYAETICSGSPDAYMFTPNITAHILINGYDWELGGYIVIVKGPQKGVYQYTDLGFIRVANEVGGSGSMKVTALWVAGIDDKEIRIGDFAGKRIEGGVSGNIPGFKGVTYGVSGTYSIPNKNSQSVVYGIGLSVGAGFYLKSTNISVNYGETIIAE
ncbi:MAG: hypothetical protein HC896_05065 [Bacteroidales bacterium]|nr:hypothetical protein [Bacteroidales bacterium]